MGWNDDIASLLDDVLKDKEPEVSTPEEIANPVLDENGDAPPVLVPAGTPGYFDSDCPECGKRQECEHRSLSSDAPADPGDEDVTSLVTDEEKAELPEVDFSKAIKDEHVPLPTFTSDELMESIQIQNFGTLVSLTNMRWHAKIKDRKAAQDAATASNANSEAFEARKRLLVGADEKLKRVHKHIDAARTDHYRLTLPWSTVGINDIGKRQGPRLLPNTMFFEYVECMGKHKVAMEEALDDFVAAYPTLIAVAQHKLGEAFNASDYPHTDVIRKHFALEFDFEPIPQGGDFQGLQDAQVEKLAANLEKKTRQRLENAMQDAWQRVYEDVSHAAAVLSNPDAMFHYTLVEKLREHATMLTHLNVTKDQTIEDVREEIRKELTMYDAKDVRKDDALRKKMGEAATRIKQTMEERINESG